VNLKTLSGCKPKLPEVRFYESYMPEPNTGCWLWMGTVRGSNNYGCIKVNNKPMAAHRYSWILHCGQIPNGLCVCHQCDNSSCVNPKHLFLATVSENNKDKVKKNRQSKGEKHGLAKLTDELVLQIRKDPRNANQLSAIFNLTAEAIRNVKRYKTWRHIP